MMAYSSIRAQSGGAMCRRGGSHPVQMTSAGRREDQLVHPDYNERQLPTEKTPVRFAEHPNRGMTLGGTKCLKLY